MALPIPPTVLPEVSCYLEQPKVVPLIFWTPSSGAKCRRGGYCLELLEIAKIYHVFHLSCLKKIPRSHVHPLPRLPSISSQGEVLPKLETIVSHRMRKLGNRVIIEVLVKWLEATNDDNSWEWLQRLQELYPHLVGKVL